MLILTLGYSHDIAFALPKSVNAKVEGNTVSIGINDIPALQELNLFKLDSQDNSNLTGAEFKVDLLRASSKCGEKIFFWIGASFL